MIDVRRALRRVDVHRFPRRADQRQWFSVSPVLGNDEDDPKVIGVGVTGPRRGVAVFVMPWPIKESLGRRLVREFSK